MSKNNKSAEIAQKEDNIISKTNIKLHMFNSAKISYILALVFFIISFLFNGILINPWVNLVENASSAANGPTFVGVLDILIKSLSIILFFLFGFISLGNLQELRGYIVTWKEMVVLIVLSLFQATINGTVFLISTIGVIIILVYFYFMQAKISDEY
ncbi:MAG: hypothetical protein DRO88_11965 [Promethearchaeia archaeon]|nr:MAG: hypothetical protein DRO88_11965 [Candidatus Lokiarchaeia archaeon]